MLYVASILDSLMYVQYMLYVRFSDVQYMLYVRFSDVQYMLYVRFSYVQYMLYVASILDCQ